MGAEPSLARGARGTQRLGCDRLCALCGVFLAHVTSAALPIMPYPLTLKTVRLKRIKVPYQLLAEVCSCLKLVRDENNDRVIIFSFFFVFDFLGDDWVTQMRRRAIQGIDRIPSSNTQT